MVERHCRGRGVSGDEADLYEIIGNLANNAMKWARANVSVKVWNDAGRFILEVEDNGPGLAPGVAEKLTRGKRLDESRSGSGFGLAIVKDLVEAYRGTIVFGIGKLGGLLVRMRIHGNQEASWLELENR